MTRAWPGDVDRLWWKWFEEAGKSVGLRCKTAECKLDEALRIADDGGQLVIYRDNPATEWVAVLGSLGRRFFLANGNAAGSVAAQPNFHRGCRSE